MNPPQPTRQGASKTSSRTKGQATSKPDPPKDLINLQSLETGEIFKFACRTCIDGHRAPLCNPRKHSGKVMYRRPQPGRPVRKCAHASENCACISDRVRVCALTAEQWNEVVHGKVVAVQMYRSLEDLEAAQAQQQLQRLQQLQYSQALPQQQYQLPQQADVQFYTSQQLQVSQPQQVGMQLYTSQQMQASQPQPVNMPMYPPQQLQASQSQQVNMPIYPPQQPQASQPQPDVQLYEPQQIQASQPQIPHFQTFHDIRFPGQAPMDQFPCSRCASTACRCTNCPATMQGWDNAPGMWGAWFRACGRAGHSNDPPPSAGIPQNMHANQTFMPMENISSAPSSSPELDAEVLGLGGSCCWQPQQNDWATGITEPDQTAVMQSSIPNQFGQEIDVESFALSPTFDSPGMVVDSANHSLPSLPMRPGEHTINPSALNMQDQDLMWDFISSRS